MLALWEYFWLPPDWTGAPVVSASAAEVVTPTIGGKPDIYYEPLSEQYWLERAERQRLPAPPPELIAERRERLRIEINIILSEKAQLSELTDLHAQTLAQMQQATDIAQLQSVASTASALKLQLESLAKQHNARITRAKILRDTLLH